MILTIYEARNRINGKRYIGFDSRWPRRRAEHLSVSKNPRRARNVFHDALSDNHHIFDWNVLYQSSDLDFTLNIMEPYFIRTLNSRHSIGDGYNMTDGGEGCLGVYHSPESVARSTTKNAKTWCLTSPSGTQHTIHNLHQFCRESGLRYSSLMKVSNGALAHYQGWQCSRLSRKRSLTPEHKAHIGVSNKGRVHTEVSRQHMAQARRPTPKTKVTLCPYL